MSAASSSGSAEKGRRIAAVVEETGVSRELVHHYLRQGILPKLRSRARYPVRHVRLLKQIRALREDHNLPLEVIRQLFERFEFDPDRIEPLVLAESPGLRMSRFGEGGELFPSESFTAEELMVRTGINLERLQQLREARLVEPMPGGDVFTSHDLRVVALCEQGARLGVPFESFRSVASFVRIAFDLEAGEFLGLTAESEGDLEKSLPELFVRRELVTSFVEAVLGALAARRATELLSPAEHHRPLATLLFEPSPAFLNKHHLDDRIERARNALRSAPRRVESWRGLGELLIHAGRNEEAAFVLEEALERWPGSPRVRVLLGRAMLVVGRSERAMRELAGAMEREPLARIYTALAATLERKGKGGGWRRNPMRGVGAALSELKPQGPMEREGIMVGSWLLASQPGMGAGSREGRRRLRQLFVEILDAPRDAKLPGFRDRLLINIAFLLLELGEVDDVESGRPELGGESLRQLVCRLDPASRFAELVFLGGER